MRLAMAFIDLDSDLCLWDDLSAANSSVIMWIHITKYCVVLFPSAEAPCAAMYICEKWANIKFHMYSHFTT